MELFFNTFRVKQNITRSFAISLLLHLAIIAFFICWIYYIKTPILEKEELIRMNLSSFQSEIENSENDNQNNQNAKQEQEQPQKDEELVQDIQNKNELTKSIEPINQENKDIVQNKVESENIIAKPQVVKSIIQDAIVEKVKTEVPVEKITQQSKPLIASTPVVYDASSLNNTAPKYPILSKRLKEQGKVIVRLLIDKNGAILNSTLILSSGYKRLDEASLEIVKLWKFIPARKGSQQIDSHVEIPFEFSLNSK